MCSGVRRTAGTSQRGSWVGLRPLRQARRSHHAAVDCRCKWRFWPGPQRSSTKGQVVGGVRPKEKNSNSREMRKLAQESFLGVATWHDIGGIFFGDQGGSGRIDHIVVPPAAVVLVCSCRTLSMAGRRLQPFRTRERREHIICCHRD